MDPEPLSPRPGSRRARLRFPRAARLTAAGHFRRVREEGRAFHAARLVLAVLRHKESPAAEAPARLGIITGRRVGGAVERVRVRRRLREVLRVARPALHAGAWLVVIAKPAARDASLADLRADWERLAAKARILRDPPAEA